MLNAEQLADLKVTAEEYEVVRRETVQILRAELRRRGMTDAEIDATMKKPRSVRSSFAAFHTYI